MFAVAYRFVLMCQSNANDAMVTNTALIVSFETSVESNYFWCGIDNLLLESRVQKKLRLHGWRRVLLFNVIFEEGLEFLERNMGKILDHFSNSDWFTFFRIIAKQGEDFEKSGYLELITRGRFNRSWYPDADWTFFWMESACCGRGCGHLLLAYVQPQQSSARRLPFINTLLVRF